MTQKEKSIQLLRLMGWHPVKMPKYHNEGWYRLADDEGNWLAFEPASKTLEGAWQTAPNLYSAENMYMAWKVLNWFKGQKSLGMEEKAFFYGWGDFEHWFTKDPLTAQADWLDKVLELLDDEE